MAVPSVGGSHVYVNWPLSNNPSPPSLPGAKVFAAKMSTVVVSDALELPSRGPRNANLGPKKTRVELADAYEVPVPLGKSPDGLHENPYTNPNPSGTNVYKDSPPPSYANVGSKDPVYAEVKKVSPSPSPPVPEKKFVSLKELLKVDVEKRRAAHEEFVSNPKILFCITSRHIEGKGSTTVLRFRDDNGSIMKSIDLSKGSLSSEQMEGLPTKVQDAIQDAINEALNPTYENVTS